MTHVLVNLADPVQKGVLIGAAVISLIIGFWAMLKGRGSESETEYYGYKEPPKSDKPEK